MVDYRKTGDGLTKAWFKYKKFKKETCKTISVVDFIAGWNAALTKIKEEENDKEGEQ